MNRLLLFLTVLVLLSSSVFASVDLVSPEDGTASNDQNMTFEYYPSMLGVESCTLDVGGEEFVDVTIDNDEFNTFTVVNIAVASHDWSVTCENGTTSEESEHRTLIIDQGEPQLTIVEPVENATIENSILKVTAADDVAETITCSAYDDATFLTSFTVDNGGLETVDLDLAPGAYTITVTCFDDATNGAIEQRSFTVTEVAPDLFLDLSTNKETYSLGESMALTIDTLNDASVTVEVCPDTSGFVQCFTPLIDDGFPQTIILPYTNTTGNYLIDGTAALDAQIVHDTITYAVENTMTVEIEPNKNPAMGKQITYEAEVNGALGDVSYVWTLHDNSEINESEVEIVYDEAGNYTERVTVTDAHGNTASAEYNAEIHAIYDIEVVVKDASTSQTLTSATVQFEDESDDSEITDTNTAGIAHFSLKQGKYDLFVSKEGYEYDLQEVRITTGKTITVSLTPSGLQKPTVTILSPENEATTGIPTIIQFKAKHSHETVCSISYAETGQDWLQQSGSVTVPANSEATFTLNALEEKSYSYVITCEDASGYVGESEQRTFSVDETAEEQEDEYGVKEQTLDSGWGDDPLEVVDRAYGAYDSFNQEQRTLADLLGWEGIVKQQKRTIERSMRDKDAVQFRRDLDEGEKKKKKTEFDRAIAKAQSEIPLDLVVLESRKQIDNLNAEELAAIAEEIIDLKGYTFTIEQATEFLQQLQQDFSKQTTLYRASILMADNSEKEISVVHHEFTYDVVGDKDDYTLYEIIPETVARDTNLITVLNEHEIVKKNSPVLEFETENTVTYYVAGDIPLKNLETTKTVLVKKITASDMETISGKAFLSSTTVFNWKLSLFLTIVLAIIIALVRRLDVLRHVKYLFYAESRKKPLHAIQTILNDGHAHLDAKDLERAMMRYKEAKLSYEQLNSYAQNEVLPDLLRLHDELDEAYFRKLLNRISDAIEAGRMHDAIEDYARLEGTFEHLAPEKQDELIMIVNEIARKLRLTTGGEAI